MMGTLHSAATGDAKGLAAMTIVLCMLVTILDCAR